MSGILKPGYLRWDGLKFTLDPDVEIIGPSGPPGPPGQSGDGYVFEFTTTNIIPFLISNIPFGDNAVMTGKFESFAIAPTIGGGVFQFLTMGGITAVLGGILSFAGTPINSTFWSNSPNPPPTMSISYDGITKSLQLFAIGLPGLTFTWKVRTDFIKFIF